MTQFAHRRNPRGVTSRTYSLTRVKAIALTAAALVLGLTAALWQEIPHWRIGGSRSTASSSVAYLPEKLTCPDDAAAIAVIGDSHVAGSRMESSGAPFGAVLAQRLGRRVKVALYGAGGATAIRGEQRWRERDLPDASLVILAYGTNDAAPRGWLRDKTPVALTEYRASLARQIVGWRTGGRDVVLLAPPPGGSAAITARITPYRRAAHDVGRMLGIAVLDPADAFASCPAAQPVLANDALHMNAAGHQCLGTWLAHKFCPPTR